MGFRSELTKDQVDLRSELTNPVSSFKLTGAEGSHGELIVYQSSRRLDVWMDVHTFKHKYLRNQVADRNQILSEASLWWGKGCIRFLTRSDQNSGFHGNG